MFGFSVHLTRRRTFSVMLGLTFHVMLGLDPSIYRRAKARNSEHFSNERAERDARVKLGHDGVGYLTAKIRTAGAGQRA